VAAAEGGFEGLHPVIGADVARASTTLAEAFVDDPVKCFLVGRDEVPVATSQPFFNVFLRMQIPHGLTFATPGFESVAVWAPPGQWKVPVSQIVRNSPTFLKLYKWRFVPNLVVLSDIEKQHPREPHYYLEFVGTKPAAQGKGMGTKLIEPMCAKADAEGVGMYLESSKESNVPFYSRFGFEVRDTLQHRRNGPTMWLMWRDPR
jgi:ribosomal protein S18 acetylase RimI-like enzyme